MPWNFLPPAARLMLVLALGSAAVVVLRPAPDAAHREFWLFSRTHQALYETRLAAWNATHGTPLLPVILSSVVLERRIQSAFYSGTPAADLVEVERRTVPPLFSGPLADVGFADLTDRIKAEGIDKEIVPASFSPWTSRGRIFGLPHDVHPVLLAYRADIVEAAGIDLSRVRTWDEFFAALRPLQRPGPDGVPAHVPLAFSISDPAQVEALLLQGDGSLFDDEGNPRVDAPRNAELLARLVGWTLGSAPQTVQADEFSASGNRLKLEGFVLAALMPDWLTQTWRLDMPGLAGKVKLIPLPAWEEGGRRTTVMGGTMLGLPKASGHFEENWAAAKELYLGEDEAVALFEKTGIVTPVSKFWGNPVFDRPDPFFDGQKTGRLFVGAASAVPRRPSSPLNNFALDRVVDAA
ncbi:MAG TPA: extracellular solute-binding protein, partial [Candidatus Methylacidiphilales bacterium]